MSRALPFLPLAAPASPLVGTSGDAGIAVRVSFGLAGLDERLGGGLVEAALHELYAASDADSSAATGFALLLALRCARPGPVVWLREDRASANGRLYGLGLAELGFDPDRLLLVQAPDTLALLRAGAEAVACAAVSVVVIAPWGRAAALDLTATRRLALAAARSGVLTLLLRSGEVGPSAAQSRWQVKAAPSPALLADAPGAPAFEISLLRHRSGIAGFKARLEWNREQRNFGLGNVPALSGAAPAAVIERAHQAPVRRAA
jgi:protein ImuA